MKLSHKIQKDEYTEYVCDTFDIQDRDTVSTEIHELKDDLESFEWSVGVIVGNSGCGKSSILKTIGTLKDFEFDLQKSLISNFDWLSPKDAACLLTSIGLSSVPTWLRPFGLLSNGEQYRAKLAMSVAKAESGEIILIDEFTSVVDRDVAKAMSFALQKYIRRQGKQIVLASCHFDILDWLMPDWVFSPEKGGALERGDYLRQGRPSIELQVSRVESEVWDVFKKHHYLTSSVNPSCKFILFEWDGKPVGIVAAINQPRKGCPEGYSLSRTVILPDFQGIGLGVKLSEFVAGVIKNEGGKVYTKTINPALGIHRNTSPSWRGPLKNGKTGNINDDNAKNRFKRSSYCHEYVGDGMPGFSALLLPITEMRKEQKEYLKIEKYL